MDALDVRILGRLLNNCRESDRQVGRALGVSGGAVGSRVRRMLRDGVIERFALRVEPPALGRGLIYVVASGQDPGEVMRRASLVGEPYVVVPCVGGVTVCGIAVEGGAGRKTGLAKEAMGGARVLSMFEAEAPGAGRGLTRTDLAVMSELAAGPRRRIEDVAAAAGLSTKTVARSIEKLHADPSVAFTLVYDPTAMGRFIPHAVLAWIPGDLPGTLARLEAGFSGSFLQAPFVAKNQVVLFMYGDSIFRLDELTQGVRAVPGVDSADLFIPKRIVLPGGWLEGAMRDASRSPTLHIAYRTS